MVGLLMSFGGGGVTGCFCSDEFGERAREVGLCGRLVGCIVQLNLVR